MIQKICFQEPPSLSSSKWSSDFVDFVKKCLTKDVEKRPSAEVLLDVRKGEWSEL